MTFSVFMKTNTASQVIWKAISFKSVFQNEIYYHPGFFLEQIFHRWGSGVWVTKAYLLRETFELYCLSHGRLLRLKVNDWASSSEGTFKAAIIQNDQLQKFRNWWWRDCKRPQQVCWKLHWAELNPNHKQHRRSAFSGWIRLMWR